MEEKRTHKLYFINGDIVTIEEDGRGIKIAMPDGELKDGAVIGTWLHIGKMDILERPDGSKRFAFDSRYNLQQLIKEEYVNGYGYLSFQKENAQ
jgi:hypothetical protein